MIFKGVKEMENNAIITLKTKQDIDGEEDLIEVTTQGKYVKRGDKYYVSYEGSEITGYEGTKTTLKISDKDKSVMLLRHGEAATQMFFEKGNKCTGLYNTPFGRLTVDVSTTDLSIDVGEGGGKVNLQYFIGVNNEMPIKNNLSVEIKMSN